MEAVSKFFTGTNRRVIIGSPTMQASTRRICVPIRMPLSGESVIGMPDWLGEGYTAVSKFASEMTPEVEQIADITLAFSNDKPADQLFAAPSAKVPQAELRGFSVERAGDAEDPDVELKFKAFTPYARDFWAWIGEMAGKEVYMAFPSSLGGTVAVAEKSQPLPLSDAPSVADEFGPGTAQFERQVAQSLGAHAAGPRMERVETPKARGGREESKRKPVPAGVQ